jgi:hypothetical protein
VLTVVFFGVLCFFAVRLWLTLVTRAQAGTTAVRAKAHWLWITLAVLVALGFAAYH